MINKKKIENCLIAILAVGLIVLIVWRLDIIRLLTERKERAEIEAEIEAWTETAKENLKEDFLFMEGENYLFVKGKLTSECTKLDPSSHCPVSMFKAKINGNSLFVDGFQFAISTLDIYPYPVNEGINVLGFLGKNHNDNANLEFEILDYIPNTTLCKNPHDTQELCTIKWTKKVFLNKPVLAESLLVEITDFDYSFLEKELKLSLKGETESGEALDVILSVYRDFKSKKSLVDKKRNLELKGSNGIYNFEFTGSFSISDPQASYSVLLLITKENSFYAKEWTFENGKVVESIVYE